MLSAISEFLVSLTYPPFLSLWLLLCGAVAVALRWRRSGTAMAVLAVAWSLSWSIPQCAQWLRAPLEQRYPQVEAGALPSADAIVVLGGGSYAWLHRAEVRLEDLENSRLATGARAWFSGRAPVIVLSGGRGGNGQSEAALMALAMDRVGVPSSALMLEERSRDTRDNALFTARLARQHDIRRVLLVTSALHIPRASYWFREAGLEVIPVPVPEPGIQGDWKRRWLPSRDALWRSGRAWKEYAGLLEAHLETAFKRVTGKSLQRDHGNARATAPLAPASHALTWRPRTLSGLTDNAGICHFRRKEPPPCEAPPPHPPTFPSAA